MTFPPCDVRARKEPAWVDWFHGLIVFDGHFMHSYVFGLTMLVVYKGYALKYESRLPLYGNILFLMCFPLLQHVRHYTGAIALSQDPLGVGYTAVFLWLTACAIGFSVYFKSY